MSKTPERDTVGYIAEQCTIHYTLSIYMYNTVYSILTDHDPGPYRPWLNRTMHPEMKTYFNS